MSWSLPSPRAGTSTPRQLSNKDVKQALAILALLLMAALPSAAAETTEWGQTLDGLRMSVAILPDSRGDLQVRVMVNYLGDSPLLLPFAFAGGKGISRYRLRLSVSAPDGQHNSRLTEPRP
jgi:hypothetical protein